MRLCYNPLLGFHGCVFKVTVLLTLAKFDNLHDIRPTSSLEETGIEMAIINKCCDFDTRMRTFPSKL